MTELHTYINGLHIELLGEEGEPILSAQQHFPQSTYQRYLRLYGFRPILITLRGYRPSTLVDSDLGSAWYDVWAEDVYSIAQALGLDQFYYTGHSHGAGVGWHLVQRHPSSVRAFISVCGAPHDRRGGDTSEGRKLVLAAAENPTLIDELYSTRVHEAPSEPALRDQYLTTLQEWHSWLKSRLPQELRINPRKVFPHISTNEQLADLLSTIAVPLLNIADLSDTIVPLHMVLLVAQAVPSAKTVLYHGFGHSLATLLPQQIAADIRQFVDSLHAAQAPSDSSTR